MATETRCRFLHCPVDSGNSYEHDASVAAVPRCARLDQQSSNT
jgi:hypothetical protein